MIALWAWSLTTSALVRTHHGLGWMRRIGRLGLIGLPLPLGHPDNSKPRTLVSMHATRWLFHGSKGATSRTRTSGSSPGELPRAEASGPHSDERRRDQRRVCVCALGSRVRTL